MSDQGVDPSCDQLVISAFVTLHQVIEVPPGVEHGELPGDLPQHTYEEPGVGDQTEAGLEVGDEEVD